MSLEITSLMYQTDYQNNQPSQDAFSTVFFPRVSPDMKTNTVTVTTEVPVNEVEKEVSHYQEISDDEKTENRKHTTAYFIPYRESITLIPDVADKPFGNMRLFSSALSIRTHNEAVLLIANTILAIDDFNNGKYSKDYDAAIFGTGQLLVRPTVVRDTSSYNNVSHRLIIDVIKKMYYETNFEKALNLLKEQGIESDYSINIGAGLGIVKFLEDFPNKANLSGREFSVNVVATSHLEMTNKIVITFDVVNKADPNTINPLNFGNTLWNPEPVLHVSANAGDESQTIEKLRPRYQLVVNCPIIGLIEVK